MLGDAGAADGRLLSVSRSSAAGVSVDVRLSRPVGFGVATSDRAVLRIPAGRRRVAVALAELALPTAFE